MPPPLRNNPWLSVQHDCEADRQKIVTAVTVGINANMAANTIGPRIFAKTNETIEPWEVSNASMYVSLGSTIPRTTSSVTTACRITPEAGGMAKIGATQCIRGA